MIQISVRGVMSAINAVKQKARIGEERLSQVIAESALNIQREAKHIAPIRTGNLRNSIQAEIEKEKAYVKAYAPYAHYVEYGTSKMRARPYMRPAVEKEKARLRSLKWR